jgi:predicted ferric reductase
MNSFWDWFWLLVWTFVFVMYLMVLFHIIADLFRDKDLSGWWKALWIIFLIIFPFLAAFIYLIARGKGMAERHAGEMRQAQAATDQYIKSVASQGASPADQIASAKSLLDSGAITQQEYEQLKAKALAS